MQELARVEKRLALPYFSLNLLQREAPGRSCQRGREEKHLFGSRLKGLRCVHFCDVEIGGPVRKNSVKKFLFFICIELPRVMIEIKFIMSVAPSHSVF